MNHQSASSGRPAARLAAAVILLPLVSGAFEENNRFRPGSFPGQVETTAFSIPLEAGSTLVVFPPVLMKDAARFQQNLAAVCGQPIDILTDGDVGEAEVRARNLIIAGNLQNNRWVRQLYLRRLAFADAYFPGAGGVVITPAVSPWNREKNMIVIGFSRDEDGPAAVAEFLRLLGRGVRAVGPVRFLKTGLAFPRPPENIDKTLAAITGEFVIFPPYREVILWGLAYHLTGDPIWAGYFRVGCRALYERARKSGSWVPEPWTTLYFDLWRFFLVWGLLDRDPSFSASHRAIVEELLWNYWQVLDGDRNFPHFRADVMVPDEIRQNHTTFLALDLFCAHRYYRDKYGMAGLERLRAKFEPAMSAQVEAVHGNDDAGFGYWINLVFGYIYLAPNHALLYKALQGDEGYLAAPQLRKFADLLVTITDNRRDGASFGDVSGYDHRLPGLPRGMTEKYLEIAAAAEPDGQFHWVYEWLAGGSGFELNNLFDGEYAIEAPVSRPDRFLGIHPVVLDDFGLRWAARRAENPGFLPEEGRPYVDKMSFRRDFEADSEYLLLDGTSTFAHGHQDGNTVVRLTWKDRIWLFDLDYINLTPRYHNGITITRNGVQEAPPPLTALDFSADLRTAGLTRTSSRDHSGADWCRNIIWKKGEYFIFLDDVRARVGGEFRLGCRWRTRGETALRGGALIVRQGDREFGILGADGALRRVTTEKESYWNTWNYPWGNQEIKVLEAVKTAAFEPGAGWTFAHLMCPLDDAPGRFVDFRRLDSRTFVIESGGAAVAGLDPACLREAGIQTDAALYLVDARALRLADATYFQAGDVVIQGPPRFSLEVDLESGKGTLLAPGAGGNLILKNGSVEGRAARASGPAVTAFDIRASVALPDLARFLNRTARDSRAPSLPPPRRSWTRFGIAAGAVTELDDSWTALEVDGGTTLLGNGRGEVLRVEDGKARMLWASPVRRPVNVIRAADIDADGANEILAADDAENLFAVSAGGRRLWSARLTKYMGENANAADIAAGPPAAEKPVVFVATNGFKILAFDARGRRCWENLVRYHRQTKIRVVEDGGRLLVVVGTVYSTPVNVFDAATGRPLWHTWEQVGDEMGSTTDYCGIHLTDMLFLDADRDGAKEVIFGTRYNRVYALRLSDGSTVWEANVGDEVRCLKGFVDPESGDDRIIVGTESGDVVVLDRRGRRRARVELGSPIVGLEIMAFPEFAAVEFLAGSADGRVEVFDDRLGVRGALDLGRGLRAIAPSGPRRGPPRFLLLSEKMLQSIDYIHDRLRKSRVHEFARAFTAGPRAEVGRL